MIMQKGVRIKCAARTLFCLNGVWPLERGSVGIFPAIGAWCTDHVDRSLGFWFCMTVIKKSRAPYFQSPKVTPTHLLNFASRDHHHSRLLAGHVRICGDTLEHAQLAFGQWCLPICLLYLSMNGQTLYTALPFSAVIIVDCSFQGFQFFWQCPVPIENELQGSLFCTAKTVTPNRITRTLACIFEYEVSRLKSCPSWDVWCTTGALQACSNFVLFQQCLEVG